LNLHVASNSKIVPKLDLDKKRNIFFVKEITKDMHGNMWHKRGWFDFKAK
jgi:hypothetical protein